MLSQITKSRIVVSAVLFLFFAGVFVVRNYMVNASDYGTVIILNGPSAVGKLSIMRAFQAKRVELWLGIGIDNFFVGVLPINDYVELQKK